MDRAATPHEISMNLDTYRAEIAALRARMLGQSRSGSDLKRRTIVSASLFNLLPALPPERHDEIIDGILLHQQWAVHDQYHVELAHAMELSGALPDRAHGPTIFCAFHTGSYRLLIPYLIKQGVVFTLVIDAQVAQRQGDDFAAVVAAACASFGAAPDCCRIIDTSAPGLLFAMIRELKQGRNLLLFIDGNTGVDATRDGDGNRIDIDFCGQQLGARKGIAHVAHLTGTGMTTLYTYRDPVRPEVNHVHCLPPLLAPAGMARDDFARLAIQATYAHLERLVKRAPEQWESWFYIEQSLQLARMEPPVELAPDLDRSAIGLRFNAPRYTLSMPVEGEHLLFDRRYYRSHFISAEFAAFLGRFEQRAHTVTDSLAHEAATPALLATLLKRGILAPCDP
jgi:KDO2-lipid IV(A) lauroyltransferase